LIQNQSLIISTGGGLPCYFNNHELFQEPNIISIYLKYQPKNLAKRLISDKINRPIVAKIGEDELLEFVSKHLFERNQYYMQAEHIISCDDKTIDEIVEECLTIIHTS